MGRGLHRRLLVLAAALLLWAGAGHALDRTAFTFTRYELQARLVPAEHAFAAQGKLTLRNDSKEPQKALALQISSTLAWTSIRLGGEPLTFVNQPYESDIDHSGQLSEAVVALPREIAPQAAVELEVEYSGTVPSSTARLTRIGTPQNVAEHTEWDQISAAFTAVRGIGYVCWYPVAMESQSLSEGNRLFEALAEWKARHAASTMRLTLVGPSPPALLTNGKRTGNVYEFAPMGAAPPSFAVADTYKLLQRPISDIYHLPAHAAGAKDYALGAEKVLPLITEWFGPAREKIVVIELPDPLASPFESGPLVFTPFVPPGATRDEAALASAVQSGMAEINAAHALVHACFRSNRPWIAEGLAHFAQALVRERAGGRDAALDYLRVFRQPLAEAERAVTAAAAGTAGQPLTRAIDQIYFRGKAMYVWWMLRDMLGDVPLQRALRTYRATDDREPGYLQRLLEAQAHRKLEWFFDDWVYRDRGLPDFRIASAYPRSLLVGEYSVTVTVENRGDAGAEVPIAARTAGGTRWQRMEVRARATGVTRIPVSTPVLEVIINDGSVPESDISNNRFNVEAAK